MHHFFVTPEQMQSNFLVLTGENAAHAKVLRLKCGDEVLICDGMGNGEKAAFTSRLSSVFLEKMLEERLPLYRRFCDIEISNNTTPEECANSIIKALGGDPE